MTRLTPCDRRRWHRRVAVGLAAATLLLMSVPTRAQTTAEQDRLTRQKLDRLLQAVVDRGDVSTVRVIIRSKPGQLDELREAVEAHGHDVVRELLSSEAVVAKVPTDELLVLAAEPSLAGISSDGMTLVPIVERDPR